MSVSDSVHGGENRPFKTSGHPFHTVGARAARGTPKRHIARARCPQGRRNVRAASRASVNFGRNYIPNQEINSHLPQRAKPWKMASNFAAHEAGNERSRNKGVIPDFVPLLPCARRTRTARAFPGAVFTSFDRVKSWLFLARKHAAQRRASR